MRIRNIHISLILVLSIISNLHAGDIRDSLKAIASKAKGHTGVGLFIIETKKSAWLNELDHFPMQSVYKLPIGMAALVLADSGVIKLDDVAIVKKSELIGPYQHSPIRDKHPEGNFQITIRELLYYAVSESDGTASDVLMRIAGGPDKVMGYLNKIGIKDIQVSNTELEIGQHDSVQYQNWATPKAAIQLLQALYEGRGLKTESKKLLIKLMSDTQTGKKRLKGLLPEGTVVSHKTGTSGTVDGITAATNDIGIITLPNGHHLLAAVFVSDSKADNSTCEIVIAQIARLAWNYWGNNN